VSLSAYSQSCDISGDKYFTFEDIKSTLSANNCNSCHNSESGITAWSFDTYESMFTNSECGEPIITRGDAGSSILFDVINNYSKSCSNPTHENNHILLPEEVFAIESWINSGATEDCIPLFEDVRNTLISYQCANCHNHNSSWSLSSYLHATGRTGSSLCDDVTITYDASNSMLYQLVSTGSSECEDNPVHNVISDEDQKQVRDWINAGTPEFATALPVELSSFDVFYEKGSPILLKWISASEIGTDKYLIERSFDGRKFEPIDEVLAVGQSSISQSYSYNDKDKYIGVAYYRLRILDLDGTTSFSHILSINQKPTREILNIRPNIINQGSNLSVEWYSDQDRTYAYGHIVDITGLEVEKVLLYDGKNLITIPQLGKGMYYLIVYDYYESQVIKRFVVSD